MGDGDMEMLAKHMGHNINIHLDHYKVQTSIVERSRVAKMLHDFENGRLQKYLDFAFRAYVNTKFVCKW